jgi:hypothetical protein
MQALADFLTRLAGGVVDDDARVQSYVLEIHLTLCSLAQCLHDRDLVEFPQVVQPACAWWTGGINAILGSSVRVSSVLMIDA